MKELVKDLKRMFKYANEKAQKFDDVAEDENAAFVYPHNESVLNPKYISFEHYFQITALEEFMKISPDLTNEQVLEVLQQDEAFAFLLELNGKINNMLNELRRHGSKAVAIMYVSDKMYPKDADVNV